MELTDALTQVSFEVQAALTQVADEAGLTVAQLRLLGILRDREPTMLELARHLGVEKSSVTGLVDRAQTRGLVRRAADPSDGRGVRVQLTHGGRAVATRGEAAADAAVAALAATLTARQQAELVRLLGMLLRAEVR